MLNSKLNHEIYHGVAFDPFWIHDTRVCLKSQLFHLYQTSFRNAHMQCIVPPRTRAPDASCPIVNLLNVYILRLIWVENGRHSSARLSGPWRHRKFKPRSNPLNLGSFSSTREKNIPASVSGYRYRVIHIVSLFNVWWAQPPVKSAFSHLVKGYLSYVWQE